MFSCARPADPDITADATASLPQNPGQRGPPNPKRTIRDIERVEGAKVDKELDEDNGKVDDEFKERGKGEATALARSTGRVDKGTSF